MKISSLILLAGLLLPAGLHAKVQPHPLFSEHCVLQQGGPVPVWGTADPGETVTVTFRGQEVSATADPEGRWRIQLPTGQAGGPFVLGFEGAGDSNAIQLVDVLVGEVWIASGQSNMERELGPHSKQKPIVNAGAEAAKADYPTFRQFNVPNRTSVVPLESLEGQWTVCTPETAIDFSAVGFFFGRDLMNHLRVPIGLINSTWGGTIAEAWTCEEGLAGFPEFAAEIEEVRDLVRRTQGKTVNIIDDNEDWFVENDPGSNRETPWSAGIAGKVPWPTMKVPQNWEKVIGELDGVVWFRKSFELPADWDPAPAILDLGPVDDGDTTWINGVRLGSTFAWNQNRNYPVPSEVLRPGQNVVTVRVVDFAYDGGIYDVYHPPVLRWGDEEGQSLNLGGDWEYRIGMDLAGYKGDHPFTYRGLHHYPTMLYNAMIAPLVPYSIRGVIWYQGESNARRPMQYRSLFPALIADWRKQWGIGEFPFLFVQIAPHNSQPPELREAQLLTLERSTNTAMAVIIDNGDAEDIHPANKEPVGERLALAARALAYGENIVYSGPVYESMEIRGNEAVLRFHHVDPGLTAGGDKELRGFVMAGRDGVFHPATARIEGDTVVVSCPEVETPAAVRYAWENVADGNLFNMAGLPASPFRTDVEQE